VGAAELVRIERRAGRQAPAAERFAGRHWSPAIEAEHVGTRERAGLFDETSFSKLDVVGAGALALLQRLCDNDLDRPVGSVTYTSMLNARGGIECDFTVTRLAADRFRIVTGTAFGTHDRGWIAGHLPRDGSAYLTDVTGAYACLGLWGPRARDVLGAVTPADLGNLAFPYMTARELAVGRVPTLAVRVTYVGELGWELYAPMEYGLELWDTLWEAGRPHGLVAAGYRAIDSLRLEKGYRYWSADITPDYTPKRGWFRQADRATYRARGAGGAEAARSSGGSRASRSAIRAPATGGEPILGNGRRGGVTAAATGTRSAVHRVRIRLSRRPPSDPACRRIFGGPGHTVNREPLYDPRRAHQVEVRDEDRDHAVHAGPAWTCTGAVSRAIHPSTTFERDPTARTRAPPYARNGNPNRTRWRRLAALEGGAAAASRRRPRRRRRSSRRWRPATTSSRPWTPTTGPPACSARPSAAGVSRRRSST
jgi:glycine cleavage system aminomethyltransferase T